MKKLKEGSNQIWKLMQIIQFKSKEKEANENNLVQEEDYNANFKWSSTLSDKIKSSFLTYKSSRLSSDMTYAMIKEEVPSSSFNWYLSIGISSAIHIVSFQHTVVSIKNRKLKCQHLHPSATPCHKLMHTFRGNWWQRGGD